MTYVLALVAGARDATDDGWLRDNATLIVGVVGIVVSGLMGPSVAAAWTSRRERQSDHRALVVARRDDVRALLDEAARVLGGAVGHLRPLLAAEQRGEPPPQEAADFLGSLVPLGQRLRLRLPSEHDVIAAYERVREKLRVLAQATQSQSAFDAAVDEFEAERERFLAAGRAALQAPISEESQI
jgi:hypothetical protein